MICLFNKIMIIEENKNGWLFLGYKLISKEVWSFDREHTDKMIFSVVFNGNIIDRIERRDLIDNQRILPYPLFCQWLDELNVSIEILFENPVATISEFEISYIINAL